MQLRTYVIGVRAGVVGSGVTLDSIPDQPFRLSSRTQLALLG